MSRDESDEKGLNAKRLEALLRSLDPDRERAGELYQAFRLRLIRLFEWRGCTHPEELADETLDRAARNMEKGVDVSNPYAYFCGVAHKIFMEEVRRETRERKAFGSGEWPPAVLPEDDEPDHRLKPLEDCLGTLAIDQRTLVLRYHQDERRIQGRKQLCDELGIPMNALRIRVHRLRRKIESCIEEKLRS